MGELYTPTEVAKLTGASSQIIRAYTSVYARFLSTEATPPPGRPRRFTAEDVRLIAFVYQASKRTGLSREQIAERLAAGELESFEWQPPELEPPPVQPPPDQPDYTSTALIPISHLQAAQALLSAEVQRREEAEAEAQRLASEVQQLSLALGRAEGRLAAHYRAPVWWRRLFGGAGGEA